MQLYRIDFPNGKVYIGITSRTAKERFATHCGNSKKKNACQFAIHKYGKENVVLTVMAECDNWELLCLAEIEAIEKFNSHISKNGYNITLGGEGNFILNIQGKEREERDKLLRKNLKINYQKNNKEKIIKQSKDYYDKNRNKLIEKSKLFYSENVEKVKERNAEYANKNSDKIKSYLKNYYQQNKEKIKEQSKNRRNKLKIT